MASALSQLDEHPDVDDLDSDIELDDLAENLASDDDKIPEA